MATEAAPSVAYMSFRDEERVAVFTDAFGAADCRNRGTPARPTGLMAIRCETR
jgi:hypothetical protein